MSNFRKFLEQHPEIIEQTKLAVDPVASLRKQVIELFKKVYDDSPADKRIYPTWEETEKLLIVEIDQEFDEVIKILELTESSDNKIINPI
jgi:DNA repair protein RadC